MFGATLTLVGSKPEVILESRTNSCLTCKTKTDVEKQEYHPVNKITLTRAHGMSSFNRVRDMEFNRKTSTKTTSCEDAIYTKYIIPDLIR